MADIFVSYRRDDSQWPAGRINERLEAVFGAGRVFLDTVTIRPGEDFHQVVGDRVGSCRVLLAVIGPRWLEILEARLGEPNDFVRIEIAQALQRKLRVIPVLIDGAKPPAAASLPDDLKGLSRLNAIQVRADTFRSDLDQLIAFLREFIGGSLRADEFQQQGRIKVDAKIVHGAPDSWFLPGNGKTEWFKDLDISPEMLVVPAGSFTMGADYGTEAPRHDVTIKEPFAVARFPTTFVEWDAANLTYKPGDEGWGRGRRPVVNVSWGDAKAYAAWLSQKTGKVYRLLSEAEWEYCCRGSTTTEYAFGNSITPELAQFSAQQTTLVGRFPPNAWGLYDLHGNVWEWCEDNWHPNYRGAPEDGSIWQGDGTSHVLRGGAWDSDPNALRSAFRFDHSSISTDLRISSVGFRVSTKL